MPQATLTYNLDNPDDVEAFQVAVKAKDLWLALFDVSEMLRTIEKYEDKDPPIDEIRRRFYAVLEEYGITLEELS